MKTAFQHIRKLCNKVGHTSFTVFVAPILVLYSFTSCNKDKLEVKIHIKNETGVEWRNITVTAYDSSAVPVYTDNDTLHIYMLKSSTRTNLSADSTCPSGATLIARKGEDTNAEWYELRFINNENQIQYAYYKPENKKEHSFTVTTDNFGRKFPIRNKRLPTNDTLRVLMIGNSFTDDATQYLDDIVAKSGIDLNTCCVYRLTQGGADLLTWCYNYENFSTKSIERKAGMYTMPITNGTVQELLSQDWDVISLQQVSYLSNNFNTYSPYLDNLISYIKTDCTNKNVSICWHMTWSYWGLYPEKGPKETTGWQSIVNTVKEMQTAYGIDIIVPSGTCIELARGTSLNTKYSLTRDGKHIAFGVGRYILACTVFETLFAPVYGKTIIDNASRHELNEVEKQNTYECRSVTDKNALLCQLLAVKATGQWDKKD